MSFADKTKTIYALLENGAARDYKGMEQKGYVSDQKEEFIKIAETQKECSEFWKRLSNRQSYYYSIDTHGCSFYNFTSQKQCLVKYVLCYCK